MLEKNVDAIVAHLGGLQKKGYRRAIAALPNIIASMSDDEEILYACCSQFVYKNGGRESLVDVVNLFTNRKYYFAGTDGNSSVFLPQPKSGAVELKDVHSVGTGIDGLTYSYVSFELKNEDYKISFLALNISSIKANIDDVIRTAQAEASHDTTVQYALSPADELKKYKDLLDSGAITQEEFDAKKKQLLGL